MAEATLELDLEALESHLHDDGSHDDSLPLIDPAHLDAPTQPLKGPAYRKEDKVDEHVVDVDEDEDSVDLSRPLVPPKRPMAGFFLYINEKRASFKQEHPDAGVAEITKQLSAQWQGMTEEEQKVSPSLIFIVLWHGRMYIKVPDSSSIALYFVSRVSFMIPSWLTFVYIYALSSRIWRKQLKPRSPINWHWLATIALKSATLPISLTAAESKALQGKMVKMMACLRHSFCH